VHQVADGLEGARKVNARAVDAVNVEPWPQLRVFVAKLLEPLCALLRLLTRP